jgi:GGDEF domain-containing protein
MASLIRALGRSHTYNLRRNPTLVLGVAWGCLAGLFSVILAFRAIGVGPGSDPHPIPSALCLLLFLAHPVVLGVVSGALGTVNRMNALYARARRLGSGGIIDPGTGLYSPEYMLDQLRHALARVARTRETVTILILELEGEKGDRALSLLAESTRPLVRASDILGRIGEGRLLLLVHGDLACPLCLGARVAGAHYDLTHLKLRFGTARWPQDGRVPADLLDAADLVLKASWNEHHGRPCPRTPSEASMPQGMSA